VNGTVNVRARSAGGDTSVVHNLVVAGTTGAWTGRLDLADTRLIVDYTGGAGASPINTIADQIKSGYANGTWAGNGIASSQANAAKFGLGYAEASAVLGPNGGTFGGQPVDGSAVLVRYTLAGDANLDGS